MKYIINKSAIILFLDNKPVRVQKTSRKYAKIIDCINRNDETGVKEAVLTSSEETKKEVLISEGFTFSNGEVLFEGRALPNALSQKIKSISEEGLPLDSFVEFWRNLRKNPSKTSVEELYDFLEYKELPITEDGHFIAYKGVRNDYYSSTGNLSTKVVQGTVDSEGHILNAVGETIEVERNCVDDDRRKHCSEGLHVGSLDYANGFSKITVVVKVNPADVVCVPTDYSCQKCRVAKYEVVADFKHEIEEPVVEVEDEEVVPLKDEFATERKSFINRIQKYLERKAEQGHDEVSIRQIQNAFSPEYPSKDKVLDAVSELNYTWLNDSQPMIQLG